MRGDSTVLPKSKGAGRKPIGLEPMLRIHCLQHGFELSAPGAEEMGDWCGLFLSDAKDSDITGAIGWKMMGAGNLFCRLFRRFLNALLTRVG